MTIQGIATSDFQSLNELKLEAKTDARKALPEVAKQFEAIFLQAMLKSMRMGQHFLDESSPFSGKNQATFQDMLDAQYASSIADTRGIGLAQMMEKQLENTIPVSAEQPENKSEIAVLPKEFQETSASPTIDGFIKSIWPLAQQAASAIGLDPKILVAQAALETGWGKFMAKDGEGASSNNLFNIKASPHAAENAVEVQTTEYIANTPIKMNASFRKYASLEQSFDDYVSLIKNSDRYQSAVSNAASPERYVNELHKAGYATDPSYGSKILKIYRGEELNQALVRCGLSEPM